MSSRTYIRILIANNFLEYFDSKYRVKKTLRMTRQNNFRFFIYNIPKDPMYLKSTDSTEYNSENFMKRGREGSNFSLFRLLFDINFEKLRYAIILFLASLS